MIEQLFTILGTGGAIMVMAMYFLLEQEKIDPKSLKYFIINGIGAFLILASAMVSYDGGDLGTVLLEGVWVAISVMGLIKALMKRRQA